MSWMVRVLGLPLILVAFFAASHARATVRPFDPSGRKLPVALAADDSFGRDRSNGNFRVTSTEALPPAFDAGAAPGPPGLPDPPDPTEPPKPGKGGKDDGCECRAVMRAGAPLPGGLLLLLALGGALARRRARRAPRFSTD